MQPQEMSPIKANEISEQANREAVEWLIALQESPDDAATQAQFSRWLHTSQHNHQAWEEAQQVSLLLQHTPRARSNTPSQPAVKPRRALKRSFALATIIFCALLLLPGVQTWLQADYSTRIAGQRKISLDDGSTLWLGADSAVAIAYEPTIRRIRLLSGEAFFSVQPDALRPFRVETPLLETTVLGTAFNVSIGDNSVTVAVEHGKVAVARQGSTAQVSSPLQAGEWVRVGESGAAERGTLPVEQVASWRSGKLAVKDQSVADVVSQLRRHYHGAIVLTDEQLKSRHVTGMYDLSQPEKALQAIAQVQGAQVHHLTPWVTILTTN